VFRTDTGTPLPDPNTAKERPTRAAEGKGRTLEGMKKQQKKEGSFLALKAYQTKNRIIHKQSGIWGLEKPKGGVEETSGKKEGEKTEREKKGVLALGNSFGPQGGPLCGGKGLLN